jgi:hypothetical protein
MEISSRFTHSQSKAFELLSRLRQRASLKKDAALLIKAWWRHRTALRSQHPNGGSIEEVFEKRMQLFKVERQEVRPKSVPMSENLAVIDGLLEQ